MKQQQVATSGFLLNEKNEVLLVKRSNADEFLPGIWELPGGGTEFGEHPTMGLEREFREETGLEIKTIKPLYVADYMMEEIHRVEIFFLCELQNKDQEVVLSHEHQEYTWVAENNIDKSEVTEYMHKALEKCFEEIRG